MLHTSRGSSGWLYSATITEMREISVPWFFTLLLLFTLSRFSYAANRPSVPTCNITTQEVSLNDGVVHYHRAGTGPHILLLHGLFAQKEQWDSLLCLLSESGYSAIAPDLPGYGQSIGFSLAVYKLENQIAALHEFTSRLDIDSINLAGSSMGGTIAALYVRHYPRQVHSLAFIGSPLGITAWSPEIKNAIYQGINPFIPIDIPQFDLEMSLLFVNPPAIPESVKEAQVKGYVEHNRHYQQVWDIVNLYTSVLDVRPKFSIPTLIIWGDGDHVFAIDGATRLQHRFPHSKLVKLPNTGHLPMLENPAETATIYLRFLKAHSITPDND